MTKFKQGEMPGVEQAYKLIKDATDTLMDLRIKAEKSSVNETELYAVQMKLFQAMDNLSLTPASPKWEPKVGEVYEFSQQVTFQTFRKCKFIAIDGENFVGRSVNDLCYYGYPYIRPIAPSPEGEVGSILCKLIGGDNYILRDAKADIMAIFNRHKEGEGR